MSRETFSRCGMGRATLGEVWDGSGDSLKSPGRAGGPRGRYGTG